MLTLHFIFSPDSDRPAYHRFDTVSCDTAINAWKIAEARRQQFRGEEFLLFILESHIGGRMIRNAWHLFGPNADWIDVSAHIDTDIILSNLERFAAE